MKGHRTQFERQTSHDEHHTEHQHLLVVAAFRNHLHDFGHIKRTRRTIQHGHAVQQETTCQGTQHKVLHGGLDRARIITAEGDQCITRQCQHFQAEVNDQEVVAGDHHVDAQQGKQRQNEQLATTHHVSGRCVGATIDQRGHHGQCGKTLEPVAHGVSHHHAAKAADCLTRACIHGKQNGQCTQCQ